MRRIGWPAALAALLLLAPAIAGAACTPLLDHTLPTLIDKPQALCQYQGKVLLVVNTASRCGYTPQYEGLEALYRKYRDRGLVVLGFPSNDFGGQEPGSNQDIASFCQVNYGVTFPMFAKTGVTARNANPLYAQLGKQTGRFPGWNFHKYLIDRSGTKAVSFDTAVEPNDRRLVSEIERLLAAK